MYIKKGECKQCGVCCKLTCKYLILTAKEDIECTGKIVFGYNVRAYCMIFDKDITEEGCTLEARKKFPFSKGSTPKTCGFYWVEDKKNKT